ncbi:SOS response-associated peptidase [Bacillus sp. ISL-47]|uniref:SOS response-associated peptidase n=1 Tax=Bacillus sp. ISL-47 TaxID=2819130 RepID=UPI001BEBB455|nr:SOS response-associated peptidase [Bacillus sp. ISL-47]MBT2689315.1 SOS response-associated peptidase [Bacillus sp. ISL-47]
MCGRFTLTETINKLQMTFEFEYSGGEIVPRYNIAPSQNILTIIGSGEQRIGKQMKWGLVPFWAKDEKIGYKMINARAEGIDSKPSFKKPFKSKRCLIPADGFYEWKKTEEGKQPYRFIIKNEEPFAFAGVWDMWDKGDNPLMSCTIITTVPNEVTEEVHDRMPVILKESDFEDWLNPNFDDTEYLKSLLVPYPAEKMDKYPVSSKVNSPKNEMAELISPLNSL